MERKSGLRTVAGSADRSDFPPRNMLQIKDTLRATVYLSFDGRVLKTYRGHQARERFDNEVRVLKHLEARGCSFVPRLLEADPERLRIVTTNCGSRVEHLDAARQKELFDELEQFGVRHDDQDVRNVTYRQKDGRFCLIDFELSTLLPGSGVTTPVPPVSSDGSSATSAKAVAP